MIKQAVISTDQLFGDLGRLVGLPGSPGQDDELTVVAECTAELMHACGLQVTTLATPGAPVVVGRRAGRSPFTLLLYHHYDVAPTGPWRAWNHEPFQMAEREGALYGRGVAAGKGPLTAHLGAIAALLDAEGDLPCGVVVLAEGENAIGSPHLGAVVADAHALLKADACLATGGERDAQGRPFCYSGAKGLLQARLNVTGARLALPPGMATSVVNPLWRLIWALGQIKSDQEEVLIGGFYDDVDIPNRTESQALRTAELDEASRLDEWGIEQFLFGMSGTPLIRAEATMPTCNVVVASVDPAGEVSAIPVAASARLDFQLVPRQHPQAIVDLLRAHLQSRQMDDVAVERLAGGYPAVRTPFDHWFIKRVSETGASMYGAPLPLLPLGPFAQPLFFFAEAFTIPVAAVGCGRANSAANGPNEHILLPDLVRHGHLLIDLFDACAQDVVL